VVLRVGGSKYGPDCAGEGGIIMSTMQTIMMVTITTRIMMPITMTIHIMMTIIHIMMTIIHIMMTNTIQTLSRYNVVVHLLLGRFIVKNRTYLNSRKVHTPPKLISPPTTIYYHQPGIKTFVIATFDLPHLMLK